MFAIPFLGPILEFFVQPLINLFIKKEDTKVKLDANDVSVIQARAQVVIATQSDPGIRLARDFAMWFPITYVNVYIWDRIMDISHPELVWGVRPLDLPWETYLPVMAVYSFLFALAWRGK